MLGLLSLLRGEQPRYSGFPESPVDWDPMMKFDARLYLRASSFQPMLLYPKTKRCGRFRYENKVLPAGKVLETWLGNRRGLVKFDGDITIPCLFDEEQRRWQNNPWMSITPSEIFTLRAGTKRAKGLSPSVASIGGGPIARRTAGSFVRSSCSVPFSNDSQSRATKRGWRSLSS